ncbi:MAG: hypothetical protein IJ368_09580 [Oscillospiraceae bacterium]|nr:hypothetical protein [Oscillospiraceae bacterium]
MSIGFHIAEATSTVSLSIALADVMKQYPELFREDVKIASFFGSFPLMWNGGRMILGRLYPERAKAVLDAYNQRGIPYRFTFTNPHITEEQLDDRDCNMILDMADNGMNEVIVYSSVLEDYIRKTHPKMKLTSSTCKCIRDMNELKAELAKDYSLVVLDYNFNNNFEELEKLTAEERKKCEILSNPVCVPGCTRREAHYSYIGKMQLEKLGITRQYAQLTPDVLARYGVKEWECDYRKSRLYDDEPAVLAVTPDLLYDKYVPMGFENFKIEGRCANMMHLCEQIVMYMAKPEMRDKARYYIMLNALEMAYLNY